jgi:hypothetical protein
LEPSGPSDSPNPILTARFEDALVFANQCHRLQPRKGTRVPYMAHLLAVTKEQNLWFYSDFVKVLRDQGEIRFVDDFASALEDLESLERSEP